jgi:hypothetical protein
MAGTYIRPYWNLREYTPANLGLCPTGSSRENQVAPAVYVWLASLNECRTKREGKCARTRGLATGHGLMKNMMTVRELGPLFNHGACASGTSSQARLGTARDSHMDAV